MSLRNIEISRRDFGLSLTWGVNGAVGGRRGTRLHCSALWLEKARSPLAVARVCNAVNEVLVPWPGHSQGNKNGDVGS